MAASGVSKVALDVVAEGLEGRDIDDAGDGVEALGLAAADELVDAGEEGGEGFAGAGGGGDEGVAAGADGRPGGGLGVGGGPGRSLLNQSATTGMEGRGRASGVARVEIRRGHG